jgi:hypothetical protein
LSRLALIALHPLHDLILVLSGLGFILFNLSHLRSLRLLVVLFLLTSSIPLSLLLLLLGKVALNGRDGMSRAVPVAGREQKYSVKLSV